MMKIIFLLALSFNAWSALKHEHGVGELNIMVEKSTVAFIFSVPAEAIVGIEYQPRNSGEEKSVQEKTAQFIKLWPEIFKLASDKKCLMKDKTQEIVREKNHAEFHLRGKFECEYSLTGASLEINFQKHYPKIKKITVELVHSTSGKAQSMSFIKGNGGFILE